MDMETKNLSLPPDTGDVVLSEGEDLLPVSEQIQQPEEDHTVEYFESLGQAVREAKESLKGYGELQHCVDEAEQKSMQMMTEKGKWDKRLFDTQVNANLFEHLVGLRPETEAEGKISPYSSREEILNGILEIATQPEELLPVAQGELGNPPPEVHVPAHQKDAPPEIEEVIAPNQGVLAETLLEMMGGRESADLSKASNEQLEVLLNHSDEQIRNLAQKVLLSHYIHTNDLNKSAISKRTREWRNENKAGQSDVGIPASEDQSTKQDETSEVQSGIGNMNPKEIKMLESIKKNLIIPELMRPAELAILLNSSLPELREIAQKALDRQSVSPHRPKNDRQNSPTDFDEHTVALDDVSLGQPSGDSSSIAKEQISIQPKEVAPEVPVPPSIVELESDLPKPKEQSITPPEVPPGSPMQTAEEPTPIAKETPKGWIYRHRVLDAIRENLGNTVPEESLQKFKEDPIVAQYLAERYSHVINTENSVDDMPTPLPKEEEGQSSEEIFNKKEDVIAFMEKTRKIPSISVLKKFQKYPEVDALVQEIWKEEQAKLAKESESPVQTDTPVPEINVAGIPDTPVVPDIVEEDLGIPLTPESNVSGEENDNIPESLPEELTPPLFPSESVQAKVDAQGTAVEETAFAKTLREMKADDLRIVPEHEETAYQLEGDSKEYWNPKSLARRIAITRKYQEQAKQGLPVPSVFWNGGNEDWLREEYLKVGGDPVVLEQTVQDFEKEAEVCVQRYQQSTDAWEKAGKPFDKIVPFDNMFLIKHTDEQGWIFETHEEAEATLAKILTEEAGEDSDTTSFEKATENLELVPEGEVIAEEEKKTPEGGEEDSSAYKAQWEKKSEEERKEIIEGCRTRFRPGKFYKVKRDATGDIEEWRLMNINGGNGKAFMKSPEENPTGDLYKHVYLLELMKLNPEVTPEEIAELAQAEEELKNPPAPEKELSPKEQREAEVAGYKARFDALTAEEKDKFLKECRSLFIVGYPQDIKRTNGIFEQWDVVVIQDDGMALMQSPDKTETKLVSLFELRDLNEKTPEELDLEENSEDEQEFATKLLLESRENEKLVGVEGYDTGEIISVPGEKGKPWRVFGFDPASNEVCLALIEKDAEGKRNISYKRISRETLDSYAHYFPGSEQNPLEEDALKAEQELGPKPKEIAEIERVVVAELFEKEFGIKEKDLMGITEFADLSEEQQLLVRNELNNFAVSHMESDSLKAYNEKLNALQMPAGTAPLSREERAKLGWWKRSTAWVNARLNSNAEKGGLEGMGAGLTLKMAQIASLPFSKEGWKYLKGKVGMTIFKKKILPDNEKEIVAKMESGEFDSTEYIRQLSLQAKDGPKVVIENGKVKLEFLKQEDFGEKLTPGEKEALQSFNLVAGKFAEMSHKWKERGASPEERAQYEAQEDAYKEALGGVTKLLKEKSGEEGALLDTIELDRRITFSQLFNTHPDAAKELSNIKNKKTWLEAAKGVWQERGGIVALGGSMRTIAAYASTYIWAGTSIVVAPLVGAVAGHKSGARTAKTELAERELLAKSGVKDKSAEALNVVPALEYVTVGDKKVRGGLVGKLDELIRRIEHTQDDATTSVELAREKPLEDGTRGNIVGVGALGGTIGAESPLVGGRFIEKSTKGELLAQLSRRIDYTQTKINEGLVDFGDKTQQIANISALLRSLAEARAFIVMESDDFPETAIDPSTGKEYDNSWREDKRTADERLEDILRLHERKISEAQKAYIKKITNRAAVYGAVFAGAGAMVADYVHEFATPGTGAISNTIDRFTDTPPQGGGALVELAKTADTLSTGAPLANGVPASPALAQMTSAGEASQAVLEKHRVVSGDTLTHIMSEKIPSIHNLADGKENVVQNFLNQLTEEEKLKIGIPNPNHISVGDEIDLNALNEILASKRIGGESLVAHAQHLGGATGENLGTPNTSGTDSSNFNILEEGDHPEGTPASSGTGSTEQFATPKVAEPGASSPQVPQEAMMTPSKAGTLAEKFLLRDMTDPKTNEVIELWDTTREYPARDMLMVPQEQFDTDSELWEQALILRDYAKQQGFMPGKNFIPKDGETVEEFFKRGYAERIMKQPQGGGGVSDVVPKRVLPNVELQTPREDIARLPRYDNAEQFDSGKGYTDPESQRILDRERASGLYAPRQTTPPVTVYQQDGGQPGVPRPLFERDMRNPSDSYDPNSFNPQPVQLL